MEWKKASTYEEEEKNRVYRMKNEEEIYFAPYFCLLPSHILHYILYPLTIRCAIINLPLSTFPSSKHFFFTFQGYLYATSFLACEKVVCSCIRIRTNKTFIDFHQRKRDLSPLEDIPWWPPFSKPFPPHAQNNSRQSAKRENSMLTCNFYYLIVLFVVRRKAVEIVLTIAFFSINQTCTAENLNFIGGIASLAHT